MAMKWKYRGFIYGGPRDGHDVCSNHERIEFVQLRGGHVQHHTVRWDGAAWLDKAADDAVRAKPPLLESFMRTRELRKQVVPKARAYAGPDARADALKTLHECARAAALATGVSALGISSVKMHVDVAGFAYALVKGADAETVDAYVRALLAAIISAGYTDAERRGDTVRYKWEVAT